MKWLPLLWAALRRKPGRSIFTLLSIMIAFVLVGSMTGLNATFAQQLADAHADRIGVSARYGVWFPLAHLDPIAQRDGVAQIVPSAYMEASYQDPANNLFISMTDSRAADLRPEAGVSPGLFAELERMQNGLIVSAETALEFGWAVGDQIPLDTDRVYQDGTRNWVFQIVATVPAVDEFPERFAVGNFVYLNEGRADGRYNDIHRLDLRIDDPERANEIALAIEDLFANSPNPVLAVPERTAVENGLRGFLDLQFFTYAVSAAALFMLLFLTGNVMAQSVRERIPEFAVMKTIGFSDQGVFAIVIAEATILSMAGALLGLTVAALMPGAIEAAMPNVPVPLINTGVIALSLAVAFLVAAISGLPAAWRVKRLSIAEALGGR